MMSKVKLLIAESNNEEKAKLKEVLCKDFEIIESDCGTEAIEIAKREDICVVICNIALKHTDGITLCEKIKEVKQDTRFIMLASAFSDTQVKRMVDSGVDYYLLKPYDPSTLVRHILFLESPDLNITEAARVLSNYPPFASKKVEESLSNIFLTMKIPAHIKGYQYLKEGIRLAMRKPDIVGSITKELYPSIADKFSTSPSKVERAIRHAIEVGWSRGKVEDINNLFKVKAFDQKDKPTNGEFISFIAEKLLIEEMA